MYGVGGETHGSTAKPSGQDGISSGKGAMEAPRVAGASPAAAGWRKMARWDFRAGSLSGGSDNSSLTRNHSLLPTQASRLRVVAVLEEYFFDMSRPLHLR